MWSISTNNRRFNIKYLLITFLTVVLALRIRYLSLLPSKPKGSSIPVDNWILPTVNTLSKVSNTKLSTPETTKYNKRVIKSFNNGSLKHVLIWTPGLSPFGCFHNSGQDIFFTNNCKYTNCFLTYNRVYLQNVTQYDAILFSMVGIKNFKLGFPKYRSPRQKYVAVSTEPASEHPIANPLVDWYFNWTWTYRFQSDIVWRSFRIYDINGTTVGPKENMQWQNTYGPVPEEVQDILIQKSKMVAWIVPDCSKKYKLNTYTKSLNKALSKYGFQIDVYGYPCGMRCGKKSQCHRLIEKEYCFYLALETYFDEDYVTDALLIALNNYAIPIVFSGDVVQRRFLPPGSYIDASKINIGILAHKMMRIMENFTLQQEFFRWRSRYAFEPLPCGAEICNLCEALNTKAEVKTVYGDFRTWWNGKPVLNIHDMVLSIFFSEPQMVNLMVGRKYAALTKLFEKKYLDPKVLAFLRPRPAIEWIKPNDFNFSTTDSNTGYDFGNESQDYSSTALVYDD